MFSSQLTTDAIDGLIIVSALKMKMTYESSSNVTMISILITITIVCCHVLKTHDDT